MIPLYIHRESPIHRIPAGRKLLLCLIGGTVIFLFQSLIALTVALALIALLFRIAQLPLRAMLIALRPLLIAAIVIFSLQFFLAGPLEAASIVLRIGAAVLLTSLVTLTTRFSDMLDVLTRAARPLAVIGIDPPRLALMVGLTIRFIPTLLYDLQEIRRARLARGARGLRAFGAGPLVVKILRMTDALGSAIAARGFENRK